MKKTGMIFTLILALTAGSVAFASGASEFSDVPSDAWYQADLEEVVGKGIIKGKPDGNFHPQDKLTYAEFIKMAVVSFTGKDIGSSSDGHWAKGYYEQAMEEKLFSDMEIKESMLDKQIPRKHMALIVANTQPGKVIKDYELIKGSISDLHKVKFTEHEIVKAYGLGIITGYPGGEFRPEWSLDRSESAAVIARLGNEKKRKYPNIEELKKEAEKKLAEPVESENPPVVRDWSNVDNISQSSTSTLPVTDIASNIYDFKGGAFVNGVLDMQAVTLYEDIKYYEIIKGFPHEIKMSTTNSGRTCIDVAKAANFGLGFLIKDNKIICDLEKVRPHEGYVSFYNSDGEIPDFDYIAFYQLGSNNDSADTLVVIPNTFKK